MSMERVLSRSATSPAECLFLTVAGDPMTGEGKVVTTSGIGTPLGETSRLLSRLSDVVDLEAGVDWEKNHKFHNIT